MMIRYNLNGTRFDIDHFNGNPYWHVAKGNVDPYRGIYISSFIERLIKKIFGG